jgi:hypothetical protein
MTTTNALDEHPFAAGGDDRRGRASTPVQPFAPGALASLEWRQALGAVALFMGVIAVFVAWFGISGTLDPGKQMPYLVSGGIGGAALIAVGMTLFLSLEHARDRAALGEVLDRLDALEQRLDGLSRNGQRPGPATNGRRAQRASTTDDHR